MTERDQTDLLIALAQAKVVLSIEAPASDRVMATLTRLDAALPLPGTPEHRAAFRAANGNLERIGRR
jgi:hypothetical protein